MCSPLLGSILGGSILGTLALWCRHTTLNRRVWHAIQDHLTPSAAEDGWEEWQYGHTHDVATILEDYQKSRRFIRTAYPVVVGMQLAVFLWLCWPR